MKPSYLTAIAILATLTAGYALVQHAQADREIWIAIAAWLLGFWLASGVNAVRSADPEYDVDEEGEEDEEDWEDDDMSERD